MSPLEEEIYREKWKNFAGCGCQHKHWTHPHVDDLLSIGSTANQKAAVWRASQSARRIYTCGWLKRNQ